MPLLKTLCKKMLIVCAIATVLLWSIGWSDMIGGLLFGAVIGFVNFFLAGKDISRTADNVLTGSKPGNAKKILVGFFLRYAILALAFLIAAKYDALAIPSFVIGLLMVQGILYWEYLWGSK